MSEALAPDVLMARQPIYDKDLNIYAYELLFRSNEEVNEANVFDGELATSRVLLNSFTAIESDHKNAHALAFVNLTEPMLLSDSPPPVPKDLAVIEILEDVPVTKELISIVKKYSEQGFIYALDDFECDAKYIPLFEYVEIIKIDIMAMTRDELIDCVNKLKRFDVKLLAEKIETHEEFEHCLDLGFDYFQGYFLHRPIIVKGRSIKANDQIVLRLLSELVNPDVEPNKIADLVSMDPHLSYQVLRIVNSAAFAMPTQVESIRHAVVLLGMEQIKTWASMISLSNMEGKPGDQVQFILTRAKLCEEIAIQKKCIDASSYFTAGMLSGLDLLLGVELGFVLSQLPIDQSMKDAILEEAGDIGMILHCVKAFEEARWDELDHINIDLLPEEFNLANINAIEWVTKILNSLH